MNATDTYAPTPRAEAPPDPAAAPTGALPTDPDAALAAARAALSALQGSASVGARAVGFATEALRLADQLTATAIALVPSGRLVSGLGPEMALGTGAGRTKADARMLCAAAATLPQLPRTAAAFARGELSWSVARVAVRAARGLDAACRARLDALVAAELRSGESDPDVVAASIDAAPADLKPALQRARATRAIEHRFLSAQPRLGGGGTFYAEADPEAFATILSAIDAVAGPPDPDLSPAPTDPLSGAESEAAAYTARARQRMDALVAICEHALGTPHPSSAAAPRSRRGPRMRPRPRFVATIDLADAASGLGAATLHWALPGPAPRLSPLETEIAACDAEWVSVLTDGARVIAVGDATTPVSDKLRRALVARDRACRFPGCGAPVGWTDAHHLIAREHGGPTVIDNLLLLCRRCHRRVHRYRWRITLYPDGAADFTHRGQRLHSASPLARARRHLLRR